jgi:hypothetical protein
MSKKPRSKEIILKTIEEVDFTKKEQKIKR